MHDARLGLHCPEMRIWVYHYPEMLTFLLMPREMFVSRNQLLLQGPPKTSKVASATAVVSTSGPMDASRNEKQIPVSGEEENAPPVSQGREDSTDRLAVVEASCPPDSPMLDPRRQSRVPSAKLRPSLTSSGFPKKTPASVEQPKKVVKVNGAL